MKIDITELLHLIAIKPQIRTMEPADQLNHDIDTLSRGRTATGYRPSDAACRSGPGEPAGDCDLRPRDRLRHRARCGGSAQRQARAKI